MGITKIKIFSVFPVNPLFKNFTYIFIFCILSLYHGQFDLMAKESGLPLIALCGFALLTSKECSANLE